MLPDQVSVLVFLIPCLQFVQVKAIGVLSGSDLLILAVFFYFANRGKIRIATPDALVEARIPQVSHRGRPRAPEEPVAQVHRWPIARRAFEADPR